MEHASTVTQTEVWCYFLSSPVHLIARCPRVHCVAASTCAEDAFTGAEVAGVQNGFLKQFVQISKCLLLSDSSQSVPISSFLAIHTHRNRNHTVSSTECTGCPKKVSRKVSSISLPIMDRFSKFFHCRILWKICTKVVTKHTTTP